MESKIIAEPLVICELCNSIGGKPVWESGLCRVVLIDDPDYPGFCRVILNRHLGEMTDLSEAEQLQMMRVVFAVERVLRHLLNPHKINLASLGNMTPHVHWHIIPRWHEDRCFPNPIWGLAQRTEALAPKIIDAARLEKELAAVLGVPATTSTKCLP